MNQMLSGFVSEFDPKDGVGIIEADTGEIIFFNMSNIRVQQRPLIHVGSSVEVAAHDERFGPHADLVVLR